MRFRGCFTSRPARLTSTSAPDARTRSSSLLPKSLGKNMNDKRYRVLHGSFGAFTVHNMDGYYADKRSMIKVYVPTDNVALEQMVVDKLISFQKANYFPVDKV